MISATMLVFAQVVSGAVILAVLFVLSRLAHHHQRSHGRELPHTWRQWAGASCALFVLAGAGAVFVAATGLGWKTQSGYVGDPVPPLSYRLVADDAPHALAELKGQVVLLNYWATWCGPCRRELPALEQVSRAYKDRGLVVLALSDETRDELQAYCAQAPRELMYAYYQSSEDDPAAFLSQVSARPVTFVIDRQGVIREVLLGAGSYERFAALVERVIR